MSIGLMASCDACADGLLIEVRGKAGTLAYNPLGYMCSRPGECRAVRGWWCQGSKGCQAGLPVSAAQPCA